MGSGSGVLGCFCWGGGCGGNGTAFLQASTRLLEPNRAGESRDRAPCWPRSDGCTLWHGLGG